MLIRTSADRPHPRRGDALKVVLISLGVIFLLGVLACGGGGLFVYFKLKSLVESVHITDPAKIQEATVAITEITIPSEFTPVLSNNFLGISTVHYGWNPTRQPINANAEQYVGLSDPSRSGLVIVSTPTAGDPPDGSHVDSEFVTNFTFSDEDLKERYVEYVRTERTVTIRGQECRFVLVVGQAWSHPYGPDEDTAEETVSMTEPNLNPEEATSATPAQPADPATPEPTPADPTATKPAEPAAEPAADPQPIDKGQPLAATRTVSGNFRNKSGHQTMLTIRVPAEGTTDDFVWKIIESIR